MISLDLPKVALLALASALFLNVSALGEHVPFGGAIENLSIFATSILAAIVVLRRRASLDSWSLGLAFIAVLIMIAPLLSSFHGALPLVEVTERRDYRHLVKSLIVAASAGFLIRSRNDGLLITRILVAALLTLTMIAGYRFWILDEIHPETGRMMLAFRHGDPNGLCLLMMVGAVLSTAGRLSRLLLPLFGGVALATASRAGIASFLLALAVVAVWHWTKTRHKFAWILGGVAALAGGLALGGESLLERLSALGDESTLGRLAGIKAGVHMFLESPWIGHGFSKSCNFVRLYEPQVLFASQTPMITIHNTPMQVAGELGVFGALAYALLVSVPVLALRAAWKANARLVFVTALASALGLAIGPQTIPWAYNGVFMQLALVGGTLVIALAKDEASLPKNLRA